MSYALESVNTEQGGNMSVDYVCLNCGDSLEGGDGVVCEYCYAMARNAEDDREEDDSEPEQITRHLHDCGATLRPMTDSVARWLEREGWPGFLLEFAYTCGCDWYCPRCREIITPGGIGVGHRRL